MTQSIMVSFFLAAVALAGCSSDPVDAAGNYTVALTNGENGCGFDNFTTGDTSTGIGMVITQDGADASATVNGVAGGVLTAVLGSNVFVGTVDGADLDLKIIGNRSATSGGCSWTITARCTAALDGDALTGKIDYTAVTNGHPDCGTRTGCHTIQLFNGTRPPSAE